MRREGKRSHERDRESQYVIWTHETDIGPLITNSVYSRSYLLQQHIQTPTTN